MITNEQIARLVNQKAQELDVFAVDVCVEHGNKIKVEIDSDKGVSIDQCVKMSRFIEGSLNRDVEDFSLNVSPPGLENPFKVYRQYEKNKGRKVRVITNEGTELIGTIGSVENETVLLQTQKGHKKNIKQELISIPLNQIKETKIIISFK
jgi:ribosome maturation factor RimP